MWADALALPWLLTALVATAMPAGYLRNLRPLDRPAAPWPVRVILPVRGPAPGLPDLVARLLAQEGVAVRLTIALGSAGDPALPDARAATADPRAVLVQAGAAEAEGQKLRNLLAALTTLRPDEGAVVFLDADTRPGPDLLLRLLRPLILGRARAASGYRLALPADGRLGSLLVALADWPVATFPRRRARNLCWGGATALRRDLLETLDLPRLWAGRISDDLILSAALAARGEPIHGAHAALLPSPVACSLPEAAAFGVRQFRLLRLHARGSSRGSRPCRRRWRNRCARRAAASRKSSRRCAAGSPRWRRPARPGRSPRAPGGTPRRRRSPGCRRPNAAPARRSPRAIARAASARPARLPSC
jgi:hypothetical protein